MKISSKKCKIEAFRIFSERQNFVFANFLQLEFSFQMSFSNFLENDILLENSSCKKVAKTKFARFEKIQNASILHFFDEIFNFLRESIYKIITQI